MHKTRTVEPANLRVVATGLRFPEGPVALDDGSVLVVEIARGTLTRVRPDGAVEVVADCGGGPNGAAVGTSATTAAASTGRNASVSPSRVRRRRRPGPATDRSSGSTSPAAR
jgi:sugar lactone lactonase YvrE